ncbi:MAG: helix-turn-helix domain-containing protein [Ruminococcaceae bacterium]|nr:helix-turn-helix domain-containing protein [Oscillospiraceae bacterium]
MNHRTREMFAEYPDVVDVEQLRKMLGGISRKLAYRLLASGELRCVRIGRSCRIPKLCVIEDLTGENADAA